MLSSAEYQGVWWKWLEYFWGVPLPLLPTLTSPQKVENYCSALKQLPFSFFFFFVLFFGPLPAVHRAYSWICTQGSLLSKTRALSTPGHAPALKNYHCSLDNMITIVLIFMALLYIITAHYPTPIPKFSKTLTVGLHSTQPLCRELC